MDCDCLHGLLLTVIKNLNVRGAGRSVPPLEADTPLLIDANAVLPFAVCL
jgi:hypothetical protein